MTTALAFKAGWRDRLMRLPVPREYDQCRTPLAVAYERGRHAAALYEIDARARGGTIYTSMSYAAVRRRMSPKLKELIRQEARFCTMKKAKWSY